MPANQGAIIEIMSSRKLTYLVVVLLTLQFFCFFIGAIVSPKPNSSQEFLATKCIDKDADLQSEDWFYPRGDKKCERVDSFDDPSVAARGLSADHVVFSFQMPHPRDGRQMDYSRWQQSLIGVLMLDIEFEEGYDHPPEIDLMMKARLGYRNKGDKDDDWKLVDKSFVHRKLECGILNEHKRVGYFYNCSMLSLFELGSLHHDYYLLNVRLPSIYQADDGQVIDINESLGKLVDVWLIGIYQNGGFTKVWVGLKTIFFPIIIVEMIWYWRRIKQLPRDSSLLEKMLFALGGALTLLNLPLEYLTLFFDMPWLTIFNDVKQGIFYANLMIFWLVFAGEHCINDNAVVGEVNGLVAYWKKLAVILFGCVCLFVFDMCERGVQLQNAFYSIWSTEIGTELAVGFIILAGVSAGVYFLFLCYMIYRVFMAISAKQASISAMSRLRQLHYQGVIWRFRFLMLATLFTAAMTTIGFILGQVNEGQYKWDDAISLEYTSGFMTGVYGMWNIYIFGLLFLYAPSHKNFGNVDTGSVGASGLAGGNGEEIEFTMQSGIVSRDASEMSSLTEFMRHQATD